VSSTAPPCTLTTDGASGPVWWAKYSCNLPGQRGGAVSQGRVPQRRRVRSGAGQFAAAHHLRGTFDAAARSYRDNIVVYASKVAEAPTPRRGNGYRDEVPTHQSNPGQQAQRLCLSAGRCAHRPANRWAINKTFHPAKGETGLDHHQLRHGHQQLRYGHPGLVKTPRHLHDTPAGICPIIFVSWS